jgi:dTMP kinase
MKGLFITVEGTEGSGKSTQLKMLARDLASLGHRVLTTREPGGTAFGEQIRKVLLSVKNRRLTARSELLLYLASRAQHVDEVIRPALKAGRIVLCDRFSDATVAYQGFGRGLPRRFVNRAIRFAASELSPDLTLLLDIDVRKGLSRIKGRGRPNRLDREKLEFHRRVRGGYRAIARSEPNRVKIIPAGGDPESVRAAVRKTVLALLKKRRWRTAGKPRARSRN